MGVLRKVIYGLVAISLLPVITTYFAYGSLLEMVYMGICIGALITLILVIIKPSNRLATWAFFFCLLAFIIQFLNVKFYWLDDEGGDPRVKVVFTILWVVMGIAVGLLLKQSKILDSKASESSGAFLYQVDFRSFNEMIER